MADVFQFEIDETHADGSFDADENDELILDDVSEQLNIFLFYHLHFIDGIDKKIYYAHHYVLRLQEKRKIKVTFLGELKKNVNFHF